jgi:tetratricopeptide (TPR) repeat protein
MKQTHARPHPCKRRACFTAVFIGLLAGWLVTLTTQRSKQAPSQGRKPILEKSPQFLDPGLSPTYSFQNSESLKTFQSQHQHFKALLEKGQIDELLVQLTDLYREIQDADTATEVAMIYWHEKKDFERAKIWLERSVRLNPQDSDTVLELVNLHQQLETLETELLPFLRETAGSPAVEIAMADALSRMGRNAEARPLFERHSEQLGPRQLMQLAMLRRFDGESVRADELKLKAWDKFQSQADESSRSLDEYYRVGALASAERLENQDRAKAILQEILLDNPDKADKFSEIIVKLRELP